MSKVIHTGSIYRMVGMLVTVTIGLALAVPMVSDMLVKQADDQDAMIAARPEARPTAPPSSSVAAAAKPVSAPPPAPVVFGAPTMPAAPVDHAQLQQQAQASAAAAAPTASSHSAPSAPSYRPSMPEASPDLGVDPNVTPPRIIPPPQPVQARAPKPSGRPSPRPIAKIE